MVLNLEVNSDLENLASKLCFYGMFLTIKAYRGRSSAFNQSLTTWFAKYTVIYNNLF